MSSDFVKSKTKIAGIYQLVESDNVYKKALQLLDNCGHCQNGPILLTSLEASYFQRNPFGLGAPKINGLQVFENNPDERTTFWASKITYEQCAKDKADRLHDNISLSFTTVGVFSAMKQYLTTLSEIVDEWKKNPDCRWEGDTGEKTIMNLLIYNNRFEDGLVTIVPNRVGLVNTVGHEVNAIVETHKKMYQKWFKIEEEEATQLDLIGATSRTWIGSKEFAITNSEGYFVNFDDTQSFLVANSDAGGHHLLTWMDKEGFLGLSEG